MNLQLTYHDIVHLCHFSLIVQLQIISINHQSKQLIRLELQNPRIHVMAALVQNALTPEAQFLLQTLI